MFFRRIETVRKNMIYRENYWFWHYHDCFCLVLCCRIPRQKCAKSCATMAVLSFFCWAQLSKGLADLRGVEQWIISESMLPSGRVQNDAFSGAAEGVNSMAVTGDNQHADKACGALLFWNPFQFAQHARVVGFVIRVALSTVRFVGSVAGRMNPGSAAKGVNLQAGVVG